MLCVRTNDNAATTMTDTFAEDHWTTVQWESGFEVRRVRINIREGQGVQNKAFILNGDEKVKMVLYRWCFFCFARMLNLQTSRLRLCTKHSLLQGTGRLATQRPSPATSNTILVLINCPQPLTWGRVLPQLSLLCGVAQPQAASSMTGNGS
jgi:hypothetical protein